MTASRQNLISLILLAINVIGGYAFLRFAYGVSDHFPFTQEIILIVLGTVATILITSMLLNKQTEVEIQKEQRLRFLTLKSSVYTDLLTHIESVLLSGTATHEDAVGLQFLSHRLTLVASPAILAEFENFLTVFFRAASDSSIAPGDSEQIHRALAELTIRIRQDLVGDQDELAGVSAAQIGSLVRDNAEAALVEIPGRAPENKPE